MSHATDAFKRLQDAMTTTDPACSRDARFVDDDVPAATLAPVCEACPLYALCSRYAELERPIGGTWAGKRYRIGTRNATTSAPRKAMR